VYVRNALAVGVLAVFAPALGAVWASDHTLVGVWAAKASLNAWRCATALVRIHCQLWPTWTKGGADDVVPADAQPRLVHEAGGDPAAPATRDNRGALLNARQASTDEFVEAN
jgi:hypothetical protein